MSRRRGRDRIGDTGGGTFGNDIADLHGVAICHLVAPLVAVRAIALKIRSLARRLAVRALALLATFRELAALALVAFVLAELSATFVALVLVVRAVLAQPPFV